MTTTVLPAPLPDLLEERWHMIETDVQEFEDRLSRGPQEVNSKLYRRITETTREIGARMVHGIESESEAESLEWLEARAWSAIMDLVVPWAGDVELKRIERRRLEKLHPGDVS
ncbi:MAG TPA: hypothetical protein VGQ64_07950 [Candidatus Limnocylindrales bacterium]|nr:hypothetical protein [Candidatus Limnocylindrales bacterium]